MQAARPDPKRSTAFAVGCALLLCAPACLNIERVVAPPAPDAFAVDAPQSFCNSEGNLRCKGGNVEQCVDAAWKVSLSCPDGYICEGTGCVCLKPCGSRECGVDSCGFSCGVCADTLFCNNGTCQAECTSQCADRDCGDDGCGGSCGACDDAQACLQDTGTCGVGKSCADILQCQSTCVKIGGDISECADACLLNTSVLVQSEFAIVDACVKNSGCDSLTCVSQQCGLQYIGCYFDSVGFDTCSQISACISTCSPSDHACVFGCIESGTQQAQLAWVGLSLCIADECGSNISPDCSEGAIAGPCRGPFEHCFGPSP